MMETGDSIIAENGLAGKQAVGHWARGKRTRLGALGALWTEPAVTRGVGRR